LTRVLLIKTSSLGDVIHCLPAVSDMALQVADLELDWLVEEGLAEIPRLHPAVARVIPIGMRRWRRRPLARQTWRELAALRHMLSAAPYDAVVDAQGLMRVAWLGRIARGPLSGYDRRSIREPLASLFYARRFPVSVHVHAAERMRRLCAQALGYALPEAMDYGLAARPARPAWLPPGPFLVGLHATARPDKAWAEPNWIELGRRAAARGLTLALPSGSDRERASAHRIAAAAGAVVAPPMSFTELAGLFAAASAVVGVDTGLTHLASAVGAPVVAIYAASWWDINGVIGPGFVANLGGPGAAPDIEAVWAETEKALAAGRRDGPWVPPPTPPAPAGRRKFRP